MMRTVSCKLIMDRPRSFPRTVYCEKAFETFSVRRHWEIRYTCYFTRMVVSSFFFILHNVQKWSLTIDHCYYLINLIMQLKFLAKILSLYAHKTTRSHITSTRRIYTWVICKIVWHTWFFKEVDSDACLAIYKLLLIVNHFRCKFSSSKKICNVL
jgi:hypothetical protein